MAPYTTANTAHTTTINRAFHTQSLIGATPILTIVANDDPAQYTGQDYCRTKEKHHRPWTHHIAPHGSLTGPGYSSLAHFHAIT